MARFTFQLEGVLRHRERIEKDRQRALALAQGEMIKLEAQLQALNQDVQQNAAEVRGHHLVGRLNMNYLAAHRRYMLAMGRKATALAQTMAKQQLLVDEARKALAAASTQKKILEKLREKQHQQWSAAAARREAGALDELTTQLAFRGAARAEGEL